MKKFFNRIILRHLAFLVLASPSSHAATQAYTANELISLIPTYASNSFSSSVFDNEKSEAFNRQNFGYDCQIFYPLITRNGEGSGLGHQIFDNASRYLTEKNEHDKNEYANNIKEGLAELQKKSSKICADGKGTEYFQRYQNLLNAILQAGPSILAQTQNLILAQAENREKKYAKERKAISEAMTKSAAVAECQKTPQHQAFFASYTIARNKPFLNHAQQEIQRQKDGAKISGYVDKNVMYEMGNTISRINKENSDAFKIYKKYGGSANNIESVNLLTDPCDNL